MDVVGLDLHERDDRGAGAFVLGEHGRQERVALVDEVVAEQHGERVVADVRARAQNGVSETLRLALADEVDVGEVARLEHPLKPLVVALVLQLHLELGNGVEVVRDRVLVASDDDQDVVDAGLCGLFDDVLDRRLVDDRQHLLGHRLGGGKEPRAESGGRNDGLEGLRGHASTLSGPCEPPMSVARSAARAVSAPLRIDPCPTPSPMRSALCVPSFASDVR